MPLPDLPALTPTPTTDIKNTPAIPLLADLPPPKPESSDLAAAPKLPLPSTIPSTTKPDVDPTLIVNPPVESAAITNAPPALTLPLPPVGDDVIIDSQKTAALPETTTIPEISVKPEKPAQKTWQTALAPAIIPPTTKFHYRRTLLPSNIYAHDYSEDNKHLPVAVTRQDYENLLFYSVTQNDIPTARALLNQGTDINAKDANGNTPLMVAREAGAGAAEKFLIARGAKS